MSVSKRVYPPYDNEIAVKVEIKDPETREVIANPLADATQIDCILHPSGVKLSSTNSESDKVKWIDDRVLLRLGGVPNVTGSQTVTLIKYSEEHPNGLLLTEPNGLDNSFNCVFVQTPR